MSVLEPQVPAWTLGDRLRKARLEAGIKKAEEMAELLRTHGVMVSRSTINAWESDTNRPGRNKETGMDLRNIVAIWADITSVPFHWLIGDSDLLVRTSGCNGELAFAVNAHLPAAA